MATHKVPSRERKPYSMRLGAAERRLLEAAAAMRQEYLGEYIRRSAVEAARRELAPSNEGRSRPHA